MKTVCITYVFLLLLSLQGCVDLQNSKVLVTPIGQEVLKLIKDFESDNSNNQLSDDQKKRVVSLYSSYLNLIQPDFKREYFASMIKTKIEEQGAISLTVEIIALIEVLEMSGRDNLTPYFIKVIEIYHPELSEFLEMSVVRPESQIGRFPTSISKKGPIFGKTLRECREECYKIHISNIQINAASVFGSARLYGE